MKRNGRTTNKQQISNRPSNIHCLSLLLFAGSLSNVWLCMDFIYCCRHLCWLLHYYYYFHCIMAGKIFIKQNVSRQAINHLLESENIYCHRMCAVKKYDKWKKKNRRLRFPCQSNHNYYVINEMDYSICANNVLPLVKRADVSCTECSALLHNDQYNMN